MKSKWYTNMVQLTEHNITHDDILIVKLAIITKDINGKITTESKMCPARFKQLDKEVEWEIDDGMGDFLYIRAPKDGFDLGYTLFENDNNTNDACSDYIYVITACQVIHNKKTSEKYAIYADGVLICYAERRDEARNLVISLRRNNIKAIIKQLKNNHRV